MDKKKLRNYVSDLIDEVVLEGDKAVFRHIKKFDGVDLSKSGYRVSDEHVKCALKNVPTQLKNAIKKAYLNVLSFHKKELLQIKKSFSFTYNGARTGQIYTAIEDVGVYVPGGRFPYPSTVIMTAIPAISAGVKRIIMATPPKNLSSAVLYTASLCGIKEIYSVGGASAIAVFAYGTKTVKKVDMIVGPGNVYVNEAKRQVFGQTGIDALAGPSEVVLIADDICPTEFIVADLLAQVEHDVMAKAFLFIQNLKKIDEIKKEIKRLISKKEAPQTAFKQITFTQCLIETAVEKSNAIAPEHLELLVKNYKPLLKKIKNAGAIFAGYQSPTACGDYWAGPSHVLPTMSSAKFSSGLSAMTFLKRTSFTEMNGKYKKSFEEIAEIANAENMIWHKKSAILRLNFKKEVK
ncbi:MAG: histidinol dehydrogenase [Elusimicrobiota bacterium]|jgi:histidinol dehydrogenase|nr:histidinol dehydrogenase [Elusimicrobiota bacterium]